MPESQFHEPLRCPICRAPWRDALRCSRCGSDLSGLEVIRRRAHFHLRNARVLAREGKNMKALKELERSLSCQKTREAVALLVLLNMRIGRSAAAFRIIRLLLKAHEER